MAQQEIGKVLLIDDEKLFQTMMSDILRKEHYKIVTANDGQKGISLAKKEDFDLVILDIYMPGLSGLDTLLAIKKYCPELPVIMVTAKDTPENYEESMRIGASDYLLKPVTKERLMRSINAVIERKKYLDSESKWMESLERLQKGTEKLRNKLLGDKRKIYARKIDTSLETIVHLIMEMLQVETISIMLIDHSVQKLVVRASYGLSEIAIRKARKPIAEGISGYVVQTGEPLLVKDLSKDGRFTLSDFDQQYSTPSLLCVPIIVGGKVEGVINVNNKKDGTSFDPRDLTLLTMFAHNVEFMLDNLELFRQLEKRLSELTLLYQINHRISQTLDFNSLVDELMSTIHDAFSSEATCLMLFDEENKILSFRFGIVNNEHTVTRLELKPGQGIPGWVLKNKQSVISNEVSSDKRHNDVLDKELSITTKRMLCVPLKLAGNVMGVIILINKKGDKGFTEREKNLLEMIAAETVLVLKNAWLHNSLQNKVEEALATQKRETNLKQILKKKIEEIERLKEDSVITFKIEE